MVQMNESKSTAVVNREALLDGLPRFIRAVVDNRPIGFKGGDVNLYRYVGNDPISHSDPTGLADPYPSGWEKINALLNFGLTRTRRG